MLTRPISHVWLGPVQLCRDNGWRSCLIHHQADHMVQNPTIAELLTHIRAIDTSINYFSRELNPGDWNVFDVPIARFSVLQNV